MYYGMVLEYVILGVPRQPVLASRLLVLFIYQYSYIEHKRMTVWYMYYVQVPIT